MDMIKNDKSANIGADIRRIRKGKGIGQTELIQRTNLAGRDFEANLTREALVKIEWGIQYVEVPQPRTIKAILETTYDEPLKQVAVWGQAILFRYRNS